MKKMILMILMILAALLFATAISAQTGKSGLSGFFPQHKEYGRNLTNPEIADFISYAKIPTGVILAADDYFKTYYHKESAKILRAELKAAIQRKSGKSLSDTELDAAIRSQMATIPFESSIFNGLKVLNGNFTGEVQNNTVSRGPYLGGKETMGELYGVKMSRVCLNLKQDELVSFDLQLEDGTSVPITATVGTTTTVNVNVVHSGTVTYNHTGTVNHVHSGSVEHQFNGNVGYGNNGNNGNNNQNYQQFQQPQQQVIYLPAPPSNTSNDLYLRQILRNQRFQSTMQGATFFMNLGGMLYSIFKKTPNQYVYNPIPGRGYDGPGVGPGGVIDYSNPANLPDTPIIQQPGGAGGDAGGVGLRTRTQTQVGYQ